MKKTTRNKDGIVLLFILICILVGFCSLIIKEHHVPPTSVQETDQIEDSLPSRSVSFFEIECIVTAYCPCEICCGEWADGVTASGHKIKEGDRFVAAAEIFCFGTKVVIPGYADEPVSVRDMGGAIKGNRMDVFFNSHAEALKWGVKYLKVKVYFERRD